VDETHLDKNNNSNKDKDKNSRKEEGWTVDDEQEQNPAAATAATRNIRERQTAQKIPIWRIYI
jgi:hypothetical protein